jgi:hypothetical protein
MSRLPRVWVGTGLAIMWLILSGQPAQADIALCPTYPKPPSDRVALSRSASAFEGVVIAGRRAGAGSSALISPLTFRVSRWLKGRGNTSDASRFQVWDGRYARFPDRVLSTYSVNVRKTFPGEIRTALGDRWRIFATNENGVNFTCREYLGSHPLSRQSMEAPTTGFSGWPVVLIAVGGGTVLALLTAKVLAARRRAR